MAELSHFSDVTNYQTVLNHLASDPQITGVVNVGEQDLGEVATAFWKGDIEFVDKLITDGKITKIGTSPQNAVDVIYLPPFYLFKDRGVKYE